MKKPLVELPPYVELMKRRALGDSPEMESAKQIGRLVADEAGSGSKELSIIDVGCATGHYFRSIAERAKGAKLRYLGIDIDSQMIAAARLAWTDNKAVGFERLAVDKLGGHKQIRPADVVYCANAFMYFSSPRVALANMLRKATRLVLVRSYFCDQTWKIYRAQPAEQHTKSQIKEADILDAKGFPRVYDEWNVYSTTLMEAMVRRISPRARVSWVDDQFAPDFAAKENEALDTSKRGATTVIDGMQVVFPLILPWKIMRIDVRKSKT